jgi:hypothetical protein
MAHGSEPLGRVLLAIGHSSGWINDDGSWSYEEHTQLRIPDRDGLVDHIDRNTLRRIDPPVPNPLAASRSS